MFFKGKSSNILKDEYFKKKDKGFKYPLSFIFHIIELKQLIFS